LGVQASRKTNDKTRIVGNEQGVESVAEKEFELTPKVYMFAGVGALIVGGIGAAALGGLANTVSAGLVGGLAGGILGLFF
jgi:hypothetical protein